MLCTQGKLWLLRTIPNIVIRIVVYNTNLKLNPLPSNVYRNLNLGILDFG